MRDAIRATTRVRVPPERAFALFTDEIDAWWQRGPRFRFLLPEEPDAPSLADAGGRLAFEEHDGGRRLVERAPDGRAFRVGNVLVWEPPTRLVFEMGARAFAADETTQVEIRFEPEEAEGAMATHVSVVHSGWAKLPAEHPVRHGMDDDAFGDTMGVWWGDLLNAARQHAARGA